MLFSVVFQANNAKKLQGKKYRKFHRSQKFVAIHSAIEIELIERYSSVSHIMQPIF